MQLINTTDNIPEEFYVFVTLSNFMTKNNYENSKTFNSAAFGELSMSKDLLEKYITGTINYLPFTPNPNRSLHSVSPFHNSITADYRTEYNVEIARQYSFPLYPSRLSATYAFGNYDSCLEVNRKYGWDLSTVKRFQLQKHPLNRVAKVNMEIISLERYASRVSILDQNTCNLIWRHYWTGQGNIQMELPTLDMKREVYNSGVLWEYLIEGSITGID
ncbi:MAG: hypothetical protein ACOYVG_11625 [Bacteroidota bacterium]